MQTKTCSCCKISKPLDDFPNKRGANLGKDYWCRHCWADKRKTRRAESSTAPRQSRFKYSFIPPEGIRSVVNMCNNLRRRSVVNMCNNLRRRSILRNEEYTLTNAEIYTLINDFCKENRNEWGPRSPWKPSIDRIDNRKGYVKDNLRVVWYIENLCRNVFTDEEVLEFCKLKAGRSMQIKLHR